MLIEGLVVDVLATAAGVLSAAGHATARSQAADPNAGPSVYKKMPSDAINDITPISEVGETPFVLVANRALSAKNAKELADFLKAKPGAYNYGSSGNATILHLAGALFVDAADVEVSDIPYKNVGGAQLTDVAGGPG